MKKTALILSVVMPFVLCSCSPNPRNHGAPPADEMNSMLSNAVKTNEAIAKGKANAMPLQIRRALLPGFNLKRDQVSSDKTKHFDVIVQNMPAQEFFLGLVKDTPYNVIVSPKVGGTVSLNLKNVTVQQVLDAVHALYGFQYTFTPYGVQVYPAGLQTRMFKVNYLDISRAGASSTQIASGDIQASNQEEAQSESEGKSITEAATNQKELTGIHQNSSLSNRAGAENMTPGSEASTVQTTVQTDFWRTLSRTLEVIVGNNDGHKVVINSSAGIVIVKANPAEVQEVAEYLDSLQSSMTREVLIDAKIIEITLGKGYQAGINWNMFGASVTTQSLAATGPLAAFTQAFAMSTGPKNFRATIHLLSTQGNVQVLSSPRIATLNNQKAIIKVGTEQFFVTNVSSTSTPTAATSENTQDVDFSPFFSGIALGVTPEIGANGNITLHVHPLISTVTSAETKFTVGGKQDTVDMAKSAIRESDNIVTARNGQIVVLGGLMENKTDEQLGSTPFISKLPFLGTLFRRTDQTSTKTELVILLKPTIVNSNVMVSEMKNIAHQTLENEKGYHFGAFPGRFGNMAETSYFDRFMSKGGKH